LLQLSPRDVELGLRPLVVKSIQPNVLHQNVQAVDKGPGRRLRARFTCASSRNKPLPRIDA
jgi:hypothetical protein